MGDRIWDNFLTTRDKDRIAGRMHRIRGFGDRQAIDLWPGTCGLEAWNSIPHIQALQQTAREMGIPVIHTTGLPKNESGISGVGAAHRDDAYHKGSDMYEIIPQLAPLPGEVVVKKSAASPFFGTPLIGHLIEKQIDTLIVVGESTSGCVRSTVLDGHTNRFRVIVAEEGVFDREEASHAMNLYDMHMKLADVLPVSEILHWMGDWGETHKM
jgi:nicotinamidase-related amidase